MLSRRRGAARAAPELDYSRFPLLQRRNKSPGDETLFTGDDKFQKPTPRSSTAQRGATPARDSGRSIRRRHTSEKGGHSMPFIASTARACKMLIATSFALAALGTAAQAYTA